MNYDVLEMPSCDLCGCADSALRFKKKDTTTYWLAKCAEDRRLDAGMDFSIVSCTSCGHVYVTPRPTPAICADIYGRLWRSYEPETLKVDDFALHVCRQLGALGNKGKLLDFGCGWGSYLGAAKHLGWDPVGIELDEAKVAFVERYGLKAVCGDLLDRVFEESSFDAVIAQQVFEHLYDPVAYLVEIKRILKPGGVLFVSVPNFGRLAARLQGPRWPMVSPVAHVRYFTRTVLENFVESHGFSVLNKKYVKRFENQSIKELLYQMQVFVENAFNVSPRTLALFVSKKETADG